MPVSCIFVCHIILNNTVYPTLGRLEDFEKKFCMSYSACCFELYQVRGYLQDMMLSGVNWDSYLVLWYSSF
jgi:hypothetical protein